MEMEEGDEGGGWRRVRKRRAARAQPWRAATRSTQVKHAQHGLGQQLKKRSRSSPNLNCTLELSGQHTQKHTRTRTANKQHSTHLQ